MWLGWNLILDRKCGSTQVSLQMSALQLFDDPYKSDSLAFQYWRANPAPASMLIDWFHLRLETPRCLSCNWSWTWREAWNCLLQHQHHQSICCNKTIPIPLLLSTRKQLMQALNNYHMSSSSSAENNVSVGDYSITVHIKPQILKCCSFWNKRAIKNVLLS